MSKALIILDSQANRDKASKWCQGIKFGTVVEFREAKRSVPQNARLHAVLTHFLGFKWYNQTYDIDAWKLFFLEALKGHQAQFMPGLDGGVIPIGRQTSKLDKQQFTDLMEMINVFAAEHNINIGDPST